VKEKFVMTKHRSADFLLEDMAMIYFKFKIKLKFTNNKNYSFIIVNFHTVYDKKYVMLKLKIRDKQNCYEKRTSHWYIVTSLFLKRLRQPLTEAFVQNFKIALFCSKAPIILVLFFQTVWIEEFKGPNARQTSAFFFILYLSYHFNSFSMLKTFLLFVTVTMSLGNCKSRNA
jgi:hypothetical protein